MYTNIILRVRQVNIIMAFVAFCGVCFRLFYDLILYVLFLIQYFWYIHSHITEVCL